MRRPERARYESFGGIVAIEDPPALAFVDREFMRELGWPDSPLWHAPLPHLSAPVEVHFNLTTRCPLSCRHCTTAGQGQGRELTTDEARRAIDLLADAGVFHVAFGGGELFARPDALALAEHARSRGLVPNATTNGHLLTPELARGCRVFGQVNVSVDGLEADYRAVRGDGEFAKADHALRLLVDSGVPAGINCVVSRASFAHLEEVVGYAARLGLREVLFLRLKPSGRAREVYHDFKLTPEQGQSLFPLLRKLARRYKPTIQIDCSFVPHLCAHRPSKRAMQAFGVEGCGAGNLLLGVAADGRINACSHHPAQLASIWELPERWASDAHFRAFRERKVHDERCRSCPYFELCRGGCPLFSEFVTGDFDAPDPECPRLHR